MNTILLTMEAVATAAPQEPSYLSKMFKKIGEFEPSVWIALGALIVLGAILLIISRKSKSMSATTIAYAAICIALSFLLSNIRLYRMPQGGSITPASMLPLMLFSYAFGVVPGLLTGLGYGLLQLLQSPTILTPFQVLLDYPIAFAMLGLAGVMRAWGQKTKKDEIGLSVGVTIASVLRFICSVASGVLFFAEYAEGSGQSPMVYSILYNGAYMLPEMLICIVIGMLVGPRLARAMRRSAGLNR